MFGNYANAAYAVGLLVAKARGASAAARRARRKVRFQGLNCYPVTAPEGAHFVLHANALDGNPYDGHNLGPVIADLEKLTGVTVRRSHGDKGCPNYPKPFKVWISGQVRRVTTAIRREMRRRPAAEPVIGHLKGITACAAIISQATIAITSTPCSPLPAATSAAPALVRGAVTRPLVDPLPRPLGRPLRLTRCRKTFCTADDDRNYPHCRDQR
jgi:hypothetical protein